MKRYRIAGAALAAVALVGGVAWGATQSGRNADQQAIVNDAAGRLGVTPAKLSDALRQAYDDRIDAQVASGKLTKAQGDALKAAAANSPLPGGGGRGGFGGGFRGGAHSFGPIAGPETMTAAATYLGLSEDTLQSDLQSGQTLAQIATAQGKDETGLRDAMVAATKADLDKAVAAGQLTQAQEDKIVAALPDQITQMIEHAGPTGPPGGFRHGGFDRGGRGLMAGGLRDAVSAAATYLGVSESTLLSDLKSGQTLAQVATAQGKDETGLRDAIVASVKADLDKAVSAGHLQQALEDKIVAALPARITQVIEHALPNRMHPDGGPPSSGGQVTPGGGPIVPSASWQTSA
jgi:hypothetical protein